MKKQKNRIGTLLLMMLLAVSFAARAQDSTVTKQDTGKAALHPPQPEGRKMISDDTSGREIFLIVEELPEFPGGEGVMMQFIAANLNYPVPAIENNIQGRVMVQFTVDEIGNLKDVTVLRGIGWGCDEEAIRVIKSMPKWKPGKIKGKPVQVRYTIPIRFQLG